MTEFDLDAFLPYQLAVLSSRVSAAFSTLYRQKYGITVAEWRIVANLGKEGKLGVRELHDRVDLEKSKVSRAAARLERAGYISKRTDPSDKRLVELELTSKGRAMIDDLAPLAQAFERAVLGQLGPDAPAFCDAMDRLLDADAAIRAVPLQLKGR